MEFEAGKVKQPRSAPKKRVPVFRLTNKATGKVHTYGSLSGLAWGYVSQRRQHENCELVLEKVVGNTIPVVWGPLPQIARIELEQEIDEVADETV